MKTKTEVMQFMKDAKVWTLATSADNRPNSVPMAFHAVLDDGKLLICDVFTTVSVKNIEKNPQVCVSAFSMENMPEGYKFYGKATFYGTGEYADLAAKMTAPIRERGMNPIGGAIVIDVEEILVAGPGPENNKAIV